MFAVANDAQYLHDTYENSFIFVGLKVDDNLIVQGAIGKLLSKRIL